MYFSFAHGNIISWDPKIGVTRASTSLYDNQHPLNLNSSTTTTTNTTTSTNPTNPSNPTTTNNFVHSESSSSSVSSPTKSTPRFEVLLSDLSLGVIAVISKRLQKH